MYNASPLFELARIVASDIRSSITPQCYFTQSPTHELGHCYIGENPVGGASLNDDMENPSHVYVGYVSSFSQISIRRMSYIPGLPGVDESVINLSVNQSLMIFTALVSSAPFQFVGYRIPLDQ